MPIYKVNIGKLNYYQTCTHLISSNMSFNFILFLTEDIVLFLLLTLMGEHEEEEEKMLCLAYFFQNILLQRLLKPIFIIFTQPFNVQV